MSVKGLKAVIKKVAEQELNDEIQPWNEIASTASVIPEGEMPDPGEISPDTKDYPYVGAKELTLANGMTVRIHSK